MTLINRANHLDYLHHMSWLVPGTLFSNEITDKQSKQS